MMQEHVQIQDLLSAHALGALDRQDFETVEEHLYDCKECQSILREYEEIGEGLLQIPEPVDPPPRLRAQLIAKLASEQQGRNWRQTLPQFPVLRLGAIGAIAALIALNLAMLAQTRGLQSQVRTLTTQQQTNQTGLALASYPNAKVVQITGEQVGGTFVFDPNIRIAVAYIWGLEELPADQVYQAWLISASGDRTSGGLIQAEENSDFTVVVLESELPLSDYVGFGVTVEPAGGSLGPTGPKVLGAEL